MTLLRIRKTIITVIATAHLIYWPTRMIGYIGTNSADDPHILTWSLQLTAFLFIAVSMLIGGCWVAIHKEVDHAK